jgi:type IX secretion system PorP/SprF family membrane protein
MRILKSILFVFSILWVSVAIGQNRFSIVQFSQHRAFINPAAITQNTDINAATVFRKQWVGFDGSPTTSLFDVNSPIRSSNNYAGLSVVGDFLGVNQEIMVSGTYAYKAAIDRYSHISFALSPSVVFLQSDLASVSTDFSGDPSFAVNPNAVLPNVRFGAYYDTKYTFLGISSPSLLTNSLPGINGDGGTGFSISEIHYNIIAGYKREFKSKWTFYPSAMYSHVPGAPFQIEATANMQFLDKFGGGVSYNTSQVISAMFNVNLGNFKLAYAYSFGFNEIQQYSPGSQEVMLLFGFWNRKKTIINMPKLLQEYKKEHELPVKETKPETPKVKEEKKPEGRQPYSGKGD